MAGSPPPLSFDLAADEEAAFLADANECLQAMETGLLGLEQNAGPETLNAIFRAAHTLKALAGAVGHRPMAELTHALETLFSQMREARLAPIPAVIDELLAAVDILKTLCQEIISHRPGGVDVAACLGRLTALSAGGGPPAISPVPARLALRLTPDQVAIAHQRADEGWTLLEIDLAIQAEAFAPAARLYQATLALFEVGEIIAQQPELSLLAEDDRHMRLLLATREVEPIKAVLGAVTDLAGYQVQPYPAPGDELETPSTPALHLAAREALPETNPDRTVRISTERLDTLLNLVGELVTNRTRLLQIEGMLRAEHGKSDSVSALSELVPHFSDVVAQLQQEVMHARMLPIATLFNKFPRLARELARAAGKQANLVIAGQTTELDRAVIEAISDPLIHLLRNAIDHGLEPPEVRQAAGKPPAGTVWLTAAALEGQIVITIADDGHGIDPVQVRRAAVDRGLLAAEEAAQLNDDEAIDLIFRPNLSTSSQVTEVSGRGMGMDVVRANVEQLSGSVVVTSEVGRGSTVRLTLPLTLALVQAMLVSARGNLYAIPVTGINGALSLAGAAVNMVKGRPALEWQGAVLPLLDLRAFFTHPRLDTKAASNAAAAAKTRGAIVLVTWGKLRVGLVVDKIIGEQEIVVKALSPLLGATPGLTGATILGDGRIALIIDIPGLVNAALQARRQGDLCLLVTANHLN